MIYEIDTDMMGSGFNGGQDELHAFAAMLGKHAEALGVAIPEIVVVDSANGAHNDDPEGVPNWLWTECLQATPEEWWSC